MQKLNWNNVPVEQVNPKMKRQFIHGEKVMIAKMEFEDGFCAMAFSPTSPRLQRGLNLRLSKQMHNHPLIAL